MTDSKVKPNKSPSLVVDYRSSETPAWMQNIIAEHLAIEQEDALSAGQLGYMARALVLATMPYKDPKADVFTRTNGDFKLRIVAGYEGGIPFGIYPRLLMSWVTTEAVLKGSPVIDLGESLSQFLTDVMDLRSKGGGTRGAGRLVTEQMKRLFGALVTAAFSGDATNRGFSLRNVLIADDFDLSPEAERRFDQLGQADAESDNTSPLWTPQRQEVAGTWQSQVRLTSRFFQECVDNPVPIDLRVYRALRSSPMAMDLYTWLTYRASYTRKPTRPIRYEALMGQLGSGFTSAPADDPGQPVRNFKKQLVKALHLVSMFYPANFSLEENGMVLMPTKPHIPLAKKVQRPAPTLGGPEVEAPILNRVKRGRKASSSTAEPDSEQSPLF